MAVLSKIRERSMFLIIIIGLALFAFVLDPSTLGDFFNSSKVNEIGEVNGETISRQEFVTEVEAYRQNVGSGVSDMKASKAVWDDIVRKKIYQTELAEAGITIGEADVWNEIIKDPSLKTNPQFLNEDGFFDELKLKQFIKTSLENETQVTSTLNRIRDNKEVSIYNNLVSAGLGASLKEGETEYFIENTKINAQFVFVPYTSIVDSLVTVSKSEVEAYIKSNPTNFKVEASRDISYVKFNILATQEDEVLMQKDLSDLIGDFKAAQDTRAFLSDNSSDLNLDANFKFNNNINQSIATKLFEGNKGDVFGPYKDQGYFKISKITEVSKMPDSVKASHILIPFLGSQRAASDITRTQEQAQKLADSILKIVKRNKYKFTALAKEFSSDKSNSEKGGDLSWFNYARMTPAFRDYTFTNKTGTIGIVQTPFGFHIIKVDAQKNNQKVLKLATYARKITPSEATENAVFQKTEQFALAVSKDRKFFGVAEENNYVAKPVVGLKVLDENVPGLGNQRNIITWAFGKNTKAGAFKRFDLEGSHVVAFLTAKTKKGLQSAAKATNTVKPILVNQKKAELIAAKFTGSTLEEIAKENNSTIREANGINLKSPTLSGSGSEPKIVGAMYQSAINKVHNKLEGNRGVYAFKVTNRELPTALPNYDAARKKISQERKRQTFKIFEAVKEASEIEDNRASLYSAN
jgi:peptidyl-prolyl cis-trans isomerase D